MICQPCILGGSPTMGNKITSGCLTLSSRGPKKGWKGDVPLHSRGSCIPNKGEQKSEVVPNKGEQNQKWLPHPCLLGGPKEGGKAMSPLHSRGPKGG